MGKLVKTVYGDALFEFAKENDCVREWMKEISMIKKILKENPDFCQIMEHPRINKDEKVKLVETVFENKVSKPLLGFLVLVAEKNHFQQLNDMFDYFEGCYRNHYNMGIAKVMTPLELSKEQKERIHNRLLETTAYDTIELEYEVDASLLGGIVIRMDDRVVDGSVRNKLYAMTRELEKLQLTKE